MITLENFILTNNNKFLDFDNKYGNQCVDEIRFYWQEVLGIQQPRGVGGAKEFWTNYETDPNLYNNFEKIPNTPEFVPLAGDTMVWKHGQHGHIATVATDKNDLNTFTAFSQNDPEGSPCKLVKYTYKNCYGVLRPKKGSMPEEMKTVKASDWNRLLKASRLGDRLINGLSVSGNIADKDEAFIDEEVRRWNAISQSNADKSVRIQELEQDLEECKNTIITPPLPTPGFSIGDTIMVNGTAMTLDSVEVDRSGELVGIYKK